MRPAGDPRARSLADFGDLIVLGDADDPSDLFALSGGAPPPPAEPPAAPVPQRPGPPAPPACAADEWQRYERCATAGAPRGAPAAAADPEPRPRWADAAESSARAASADWAGSDGAYGRSATWDTAHFAAGASADGDDAAHAWSVNTSGNTSTSESLLSAAAAMQLHASPARPQSTAPGGAALQVPRRSAQQLKQELFIARAAKRHGWNPARVGMVSRLLGMTSSLSPSPPAARPNVPDAGAGASGAGPVAPVPRRSAQYLQPRPAWGKAVTLGPEASSPQLGSPGLCSEGESDACPRPPLRAASSSGAWICSLDGTPTAAVPEPRPQHLASQLQRQLLILRSSAGSPLGTPPDAAAPVAMLDRAASPPVPATGEPGRLLPPPPPARSPVAPPVHELQLMHRRRLPIPDVRAHGRPFDLAAAAGAAVAAGAAAGDPDPAGDSVRPVAQLRSQPLPHEGQPGRGAGSGSGPLWGDDSAKRRPSRSTPLQYVAFSRHSPPPRSPNIGGPALPSPHLLPLVHSGAPDADPDAPLLSPGSDQHPGDAPDTLIPVTSGPTSPQASHSPLAGGVRQARVSLSGPTLFNPMKPAQLGPGPSSHLPAIGDRQQQP